MSLFNTSDASTRSSTSNLEETISTVDNRVARDSAAVGGNVTTGSGDLNGVTISTTDQGAVKGGVDIALESIRRISDASKSSQAAVQSVASDSIGQAFGLANEARQSETSGAINNFLKYGVWVALAGIAAYVIVRHGKA